MHERDDGLDQALAHGGHAQALGERAGQSRELGGPLLASCVVALTLRPGQDRRDHRGERLDQAHLALVVRHRDLAGHRQRADHLVVDDEGRGQCGERGQSRDRLGHDRRNVDLTGGVVVRHERGAPCHRLPRGAVPRREQLASLDDREIDAVDTEGVEGARGVVQPEDDPDDAPHRHAHVLRDRVRDGVEAVVRGRSRRLGCDPGPVLHSVLDSLGVANRAGHALAESDRPGAASPR